MRLAGDALDQCRRRVQQTTCGHRGRKGDPVSAARRTLHAGSDLLTDKQRQRLTALFADDEHVEVEALREVVTLGRTLKRRAVDVLAYFDRPDTTNGPTEAINGRLEHLRGSALGLGFCNLTNYIARSLLETGGFRPGRHPRS